MSVGDAFGRLIVTEVIGRMVRVRCECGARRAFYVSQLARGFRSCGCLKRQMCRTLGYRIQPRRAA